MFNVSTPKWREPASDLHGVTAPGGESFVESALARRAFSMAMIDRRWLA
jgi:hypothetical protein